MSLKALLMMQRRKAQGKAGMATGFFKKRREVIGGTDSASEVSSRKIMSIAGIITAKNVKVMRKIFKNIFHKSMPMDVIDLRSAPKVIFYVFKWIDILKRITLHES